MICLLTKLSETSTRSSNVTQQPKQYGERGMCGVWWHIGIVNTFRPEGRGFESCYSCHVGTLGKSYTCSFLQHFGVKTQTQCQLLWPGALLKGSCSEKHYRNGQNTIQ